MERWKKIRLPLLTILIVLFVDQFIKIYVKTHLTLGDSIPAVKLGEINTNRAEILFVENPGMAFGATIGGEYGKLILSLFRIIAAVFGVYYIRHIIRKKEHWGYIFCVALIFAGAVGNIIDSAFYGLIFSSSDMQVATAFPPGGGYGTFLHGEVVDMFHLPFWHGRFPSWFPFWANEKFEFFSPIFNFADASISAGVILIFLFQRKFFKKNQAKEIPATENVQREEQINSSGEKTEIKSENHSDNNDVPPLNV